MRLLYLGVTIGCVVGFSAVPTAVGTPEKPPTFSMEAAAINGVPIDGGPRRDDVRLLPGDVLAVEVFLRNWSPAGEQLSAYQMQLEPMDFSSGPAGHIQPAAYAESRERNEANMANCMVDQSDPRWIYAGLQTITLVDTHTPGYRWMSVLVDPGDIIVCEQDDTKYYTGTVFMQVSDDARGTFTIGFMEIATSSLVLI